MFWNNSAPAQVTASGITVKDKPADRPKFERVYTAKLDNRATIELKAMNGYSGSRYWYGELTQPNGRWVLFDPERVAEKILDPLLVPLIQARVDEAFALDKAFIKGDPKSFIDEAGIVWRKS